MTNMEKESCRIDKKFLGGRVMAEAFLGGYTGATGASRGISREISGVSWGFSREIPRGSRGLTGAIDPPPPPPAGLGAPWRAQKAVPLRGAAMSAVKRIGVLSSQSGVDF